MIFRQLDKHFVLDFGRQRFFDRLLVAPQHDRLKQLQKSQQTLMSQSFEAIRNLVRFRQRFLIDCVLLQIEGVIKRRCELKA